MSTLRVTAEQLVVHEHTNADALELAQVGLYRAVVPKGRYRTGEHAIYIPEGSLLPTELIEELGLTGRLAGGKHNRVKAVRLRGELSQGIVCRPAALVDVDLAQAHAEDRDFAVELGVTKWVSPVPTHFGGDVVAAPDLLSWVEIEDIKRYPDLFTPGEPVVATEKVHGSACLYTLVRDGGAEFVSSKGLGGRKLALTESSMNLYWRAVRGYDVARAAAQLAADLGARRIGVFGEVFGRGVQDLGYGAGGPDRPGYAVFDVAVDIDRAVRWLHSDELVDRLAGLDVVLPTVPRLYVGEYDEHRLIAVAGGREQLSGREEHLREGIVVRPVVERYSPVVGGRAIGKLISEAYLTRHGGTEYE